MSVMQSTMERLQADEAFGPVMPEPPVERVVSEQELAAREAAANLAAVQATADALRAGGEAAASAPVEPQADLPPLPRVGSLVTFYPRPGEVMRGRKEAAAIVVHRDINKRTLDLVVIYDAQDFRDQERVKERTVEGERGWLQQADQAAVITVNRAEVDTTEIRQLIGVTQNLIAGVQEAVGNLRGAVFGEFERPEQSVLEMLDAVDERLGKLESAKPKAAKRGKRKAKAVKPAQDGEQPQG